jgi:hypothetical protein
MFKAGFISVAVEIVTALLLFLVVVGVGLLAVDRLSQKIELRSSEWKCTETTLVISPSKYVLDGRTYIENVCVKWEKIGGSNPM